MIVSPESSSCIFPHLFNGFEQILVKSVIAHRSVIALDIGILLRLAGLDVLDLDLLCLSPSAQCVVDVLRDIVSVQCFRFTTPLDDLIQAADHAL